MNIESSIKDNDLIMQEIDFIAKNTEELIADYTFLSTFELSREARKNGFTVMLSGIGGDEIFAGYPRHLIVRYHNLLKVFQPLFKILLKLKLFPVKLDKKFERLVSYFNENDLIFSYSKLLGYFSKKELNSLFDDDINLRRSLKNYYAEIHKNLKLKNSDKLRSVLELDSIGYLSRNLMVADKASMLASIELRVPLLDERIFFYGKKIKSNLLIKSFRLKGHLKDLLRIFLPRSLVSRPKIGFNPPLDGLINQLGKKYIENELKNLDGILNFEYICKILDDHFNEVKNNTYKIWQLLYF